MLAVVYAVVREKKGAMYDSIWDVFHVLLGRTFVFGLSTKKPKEPINLKKTLKMGFCSPETCF